MCTACRLLYSEASHYFFVPHNVNKTESHVSFSPALWIPHIQVKKEKHQRNPPPLSSCSSSCYRQWTDCRFHKIFKHKTTEVEPCCISVLKGDFHFKALTQLCSRASGPPELFSVRSEWQIEPENNNNILFLEETWKLGRPPGPLCAISFLVSHFCTQIYIFFPPFLAYFLFFSFTPLPPPPTPLEAGCGELLLLEITDWKTDHSFFGDLALFGKFGSYFSA